MRTRGTPARRRDRNRSPNPAQAAPILNSAFVSPAPSEAGPVGASLVASSGPVAFAAGTFSGTLTSEVWNNDSSNPFGATGYTFTYRLTNNSGSGHDVERLTISNYDSFSVDGSYQTGSTGVVPSAITRSSNGQVLGFNFNTPAIPGGSQSALLVLQTNATSHSATIAAIQNGTNAQVTSFAPLPVPEPATISVLALGAGAALLRRRR